MYICMYIPTLALYNSVLDTKVSHLQMSIQGNSDLETGYPCIGLWDEPQVFHPWEWGIQTVDIDTHRPRSIRIDAAERRLSLQDIHTAVLDTHMWGD